jgi:hypothetical protein
LLSCLSHWTGCVWKIWQNGTCGFWTSKRTLIRQRLMHQNKLIHGVSRLLETHFLKSLPVVYASQQVAKWHRKSPYLWVSCHTLSSRQFKSVWLSPARMTCQLVIPMTRLSKRFYITMRIFVSKLTW